MARNNRNQPCRLYGADSMISVKELLVELEKVEARAFKQRLAISQNEHEFYRAVKAQLQRLEKVEAQASFYKGALQAVADPQFHKNYPTALLIIRQIESILQESIIQ